MRRLAFGTDNLRIGIVIWMALFWPVAFVVSYFETPGMVLALVAAFIQAVALGVFLAYLPGAKLALRVSLQSLSGGVALLLAIAGLALFAHLSSDYVYLYQALGQPEWMRSDTGQFYGFFPLLNAFLRYCLGIFLAMHLLVKNVEHGMAPSENYRQLGLWIASGAFLLAAVVVLGASP